MVTLRSTKITSLTWNYKESMRQDGALSAITLV